jgi:hypothetical protein
MDDIKSYMQMVMQKKFVEIDPAMSPVPFDDNLYEETVDKKLRIGMIGEMPLLAVS